MAAEPTTVVLRRTKETKNTVVFETFEDGAAIDRVYLSKSAPESKAQAIELTITPRD